MKNNNILAIIPARAGSKGLKNKNILKLGNKNIINITIDQALESKYITKVSISTDSKKIKDIVNKKNAAKGRVLAERPCYPVLVFSYIPHTYRQTVRIQSIWRSSSLPGACSNFS